MIQNSRRLSIDSDTIRTQIIWEARGELLAQHSVNPGPFLLPALQQGSAVVLGFKGQSIRFIVDHCELWLDEAGATLKIMVIPASIVD